MNHEQPARLLGRPRYQRFSLDDKATRVMTGWAGEFPIISTKFYSIKYTQNTNQGVDFMGETG